MKRSRTPEELLKHEAVAKARKSIRLLQGQIADRLLKITAEVEALHEHLTAKETTQFLHAACELDLTDASAFVKASVSLKGCHGLLREKRIGFAQLRSLATADNETRRESLLRMEAGASVGTKDVAAIRAHFKRQKLTFWDLQARTAMRRTIAAARRRMAVSVKLVDKRVGEVMTKVDLLQSRLSPEVRTQYLASVQEIASEVLPRFEEVWGPQPASLKEALSLPNGSEGRGVALAYAALRRVADGQLGGEYGYALDNTSQCRKVQTNLIDCLQSVTSAKPPLEFDAPAVRKPLAALPRPHLTVVELCAGAGGFSIGLERAGYHPIALVEFDKDAAATLRQNRPFWPVVEADMRTVDFSQYRSPNVDLLVGGLPCQPYSIEGLGLGKDDPRDLLPEGARAVDEIRPAAFVFENVAGLLHARHADHLGAFMKKLRKSGYAIQIIRMEAEDYGVPQERTRILIVGMRMAAMGAFRSPPKFPEWRANMGDALADLMAENGWLGAAAWAEALRTQVVRRNGADLRGALASTVVGRKGGSREKETARWAAKGIDIRNVADSAPTQQQAERAGPAFRPSLTLRMRARLQAFPDYWSFVGGKDSAARQIGNAVPPPVGMAIGLAVRSALRGTIFDYGALMRPGAVHQPEESARQLTWAPSIAADFVVEEFSSALPEVS
ncbi:DNA (cytosine-5)-methyltransferase 1 [Rhizobium aethiopicum]|uniref:Cytosine-specific methyltransferase n=1 Tax=Rhizobium aethiopicum TaxID=1138170 RepID=A0A7W6MD67_9HYPH|nr:DNA (cytosine-5-)-methyltransferase [Rhizobium aethiopicum]MBB4190018.1 DNA (cytosine-5)-methyltransferase 1 [Rhizobium aethiopicum]MBB4580243.1 DNA (cytosine-5)-methyltransferase 1 [Rhizobium aethiopicum]